MTPSVILSTRESSASVAGAAVNSTRWYVPSALWRIS